MRILFYLNKYLLYFFQLRKFQRKFFEPRFLESDGGGVAFYGNHQTLSELIVADAIAVFDISI